jgi:hypothetical protein
MEEMGLKSSFAQKQQLRQYWKLFVYISIVPYPVTQLSVVDQFRDNYRYLLDTSCYGHSILLQLNILHSFTKTHYFKL